MHDECVLLILHSQHFTRLFDFSCSACFGVMLAFSSDMGDNEINSFAMVIRKSLLLMFEPQTSLNNVCEFIAARSSMLQKIWKGQQRDARLVLYCLAI